MRLSCLTGWIAAWLVVLCVATGSVLALHYVPADAHASVLDLSHRAPITGWVRGVHRLAAHLALLFTLSHFIVSLWNDRARDSQRLAWGTGFAALLLLGIIDFLGRALPWDEHGAVSLSIARVFLGASPLPDASAGDEALATVWFLHIAGAAIVVGCFAFHVQWRAVLREGSFARSNSALMIVAVVPVLALSAIVLPAPLGDRFEGFTSSTSVTAEWYLRWLQWFAERDLALARGAAVAVLALAVARVADPSPKARAGMRIAWLAVLVVMGIVTLLPLGAGASITVAAAP